MYTSFLQALYALKVWRDTGCYWSAMNQWILKPFEVGLVHSWRAAEVKSKLVTCCSYVLSPKDLVNFIEANFKKRECVFFTKDSKAT